MEERAGRIAELRRRAQELPREDSRRVDALFHLSDADSAIKESERHYGRAVRALNMHRPAGSSAGSVIE